MTRTLQIDFISDISCPWCIIGLRALEAALDRARDAIDADITFQPFELNPHMPREGQNIVEHVAEKYGSTPEQSAANRTMIRERAAEFGFAMNGGAQSRIYNTFDAHRLLYWAEQQGRQAALKDALFIAYFADQRDPSDHEVLADVAASVGLDRNEAGQVLISDRFSSDVRRAQQLWQSRGIHAVPAIVIDGRYLISGGQPPEVFEDRSRGPISMTSRQSILVFDVNETLLDIAPLSALFEDWFGDAAAMRTWFSDLILYSQTLTLAGEYVDFGTLAASMLQMRADISQLRLPNGAVDRLRAQLTALPAHADVVPALTRMRNAGLRLVTLTNSGSQAQQRQLEYAGIASLFEQQYSVEAVRAFKPHPSTYAMVAKAEGVELADLTLVACHGWDTIGARLSGCRTAFITRPGNVEPSLSVTRGADYVASSLNSFADALIVDLMT